MAKKLYLLIAILLLQITAVFSIVTTGNTGIFEEPPTPGSYNITYNNLSFEEPPVVGDYNESYDSNISDSDLSESNISNLNTSLCYDSDNGVSVYVKGELKFGNSFSNIFSVNDYCGQGNEINEYFCTEKNFSLVKYNCPNGCYDGACINQIESYEVLHVNFGYPPINGMKQEEIFSNVSNMLRLSNTISLKEIHSMYNFGRYFEYNTMNVDPLTRESFSAINQMALNQYKQDLEREGKVVLPFTNFNFIIIKKLKPDLVLENLKISGDLNVNKNVLIKFKLKNKGNYKAYPALYMYDQYDGGYSQIAEENTCYSTISLDPNQSCVSAYYFNFSKPGLKNLVVKADSGNQINELNEENNVLNISLNILPDVNCKSFNEVQCINNSNFCKTNYDIKKARWGKGQTKVFNSCSSLN